MEITERTIGKHKLTDEMNNIVDAFEAGFNIKGFAFAGGGKSTLLRALEKYGRKRKGLYLCYNKALEQEARSLFSGTYVHIYTSHSFALSSFEPEVKRAFLEKTNLKPNNEMIVKFAELDENNEFFGVLDMNKNWRLLIDICDCFIQTASLELTEIHLTEKTKKVIANKLSSGQLKASQKKEAINYFVNRSRILISAMFNANPELIKKGEACFCTHDAYVKFWQLSKPVFKDYDYIMFDETQDAPPVLVNVILSQKCQLVFVGDRFQNIYLFKSGLNAMDVVPIETFPLSYSFRYGESVAEMATKILRHSDDKIKVHGKGETDIIKGSLYDDADDLLYVSHTNIHLLEVLVSCYKARVPTVFVSDNKASATLMKLDTLVSLSKNEGGVGYFKKYDSIDKFISEQRDLESKVIIEWFKDDRDKFDALRSALNWTLDILPENAKVRLVTAHGSKGLEADTVMVSDDFSAVIGAFGEGTPLPEDELNLIYVALTRAKKKLIIADRLFDALNKNLAFTLLKHKPQKCMLDNLIPENFKDVKKTSSKKALQKSEPKLPDTQSSTATKITKPNPASVSNNDEIDEKKADTVDSGKKSGPVVGKPPKPLVSNAPAKSSEMQIQVGYSKENGESLYWCPTDTSLYLNPNLAVVGTMGTGKTQTVKSLITQMRRQKDLNTGGESIGVLIFDYKSDYVDDDFVNATGSQVLEPNNLPINPFALHSDHRLALMNNAKVFISTLSKVFRLGVKQEQTLKNCIIAAYERKNIDNGDVETYQNTPPTLRDVVAIYNQLPKVPQDSLTSALSDLYDFEIFEGNGRKCKTLYDLLEDNVVVVSLGGIDPNLQNLIVAVLLDQFYTQMHLAEKPKPKGQYRALKKLILVDEADNFMSQDFPSLRKILKEGREFGVGCLLSTQGLDHFATSENSYSDYVTAWICHRLNNPKSKDVEQLLNTKTKQELESNLNMVRELEKHHALFVDGKKQVTHQHSTMFWKLIEDGKG